MRAVEVRVGVGGKWTCGDSNIVEDDANGKGDGVHARSPSVQAFKAGRRCIAILHCSNKDKRLSWNNSLSPKIG